MARLDREAFSAELTCVYIADQLRKAKAVEALLTSLGVDYTVEVEEIGTTLFGSSRVGVLIYVAQGQATYAGAKLEEAGLGAGVVLPGDFGGGSAPPVA